jgi:hypothetical protein
MTFATPQRGFWSECRWIKAWGQFMKIGNKAKQNMGHVIFGILL